MQLDWKPVWLLAVLALALLGAECSGVNTSQSVSPATFLLPGFFGQTTPPPADATAAPTAGESVQTVAQSN